MADIDYIGQLPNPDLKPKKRVRVWLVLLIVLIGAGGGGAWYWYWQQQRQALITTLIPADAIALIEVQNPVHTFQRMKRQGYWPWIQRLPELKLMEDKFMAVKLAIKRDTNLLAFSASHPAYISLHARGQAKVGYVFYLPIRSEADAARLRKIADDLIPQNKARRSSRKYSGHNILDVQVDDTTTLSVLPLQHFWALSYDGQLIDDVARQQAGHTTAPWLTDFLAQDAKSEAGIRLAVNGAQLPQGLTSITSQTLPSWSKRLCQGANLISSWHQTGLGLSGTYSVNGNDLLDSAKAGGLEALSWIPQHTAMLYQVSDGAYLAHWLKQQNNVISTRSDQLLQAAYQEVLVAEIEHPDPQEHPILLAIQIRDQAILNHWIRTQNKQLISGKLGNQTWYQRPTGNLAADLLGHAIAGLDQAYFMPTAEGWLLAGSSLQVINQSLQDHQEGTSWDRDTEIATYLKNLNDGHKALIAINPKRCLSFAETNILPRWLQMAESYCQPDSGIGFVTIQASEALVGTELNVLVSPVNLAPTTADPPVKNLRATYLPGRLLGAPKVWRNATDRGLGCVVTDTLNQLYFIDKKGGIAHQYQLRQPLVTEVWRTDQPVNLVADQLSQWFALTLGGLHAISAEAKITKGYPVRLPDTLLPVSASIISYGGQSAPKWQLTERNGATWVFDNKGKPLAPFNPIRFRTNLVGNLEHYQVAGQDVLLALEFSGQLQLLTRKGLPMAGWPISIGHRCHDKPLVKPNASLATSTVTLLTEHGQALTYNFEGTLVSQRQLYRASASTRFSMVVEPKGLTYTLLAAEGDSILVFDPVGTRIAKFTGPGYGKAAVQYYHYGAGNEVWAIRPPIQFTNRRGLVWLHTRKSILGGGQALATDFPISMVYSDATRAWFVLRNTGHLTCLTAVKQAKQVPRLVFAENNITYPKSVKAIALGRDTLKRIPYWPQNTLLLRPQPDPLELPRSADFRSVAMMFALRKQPSLITTQIIAPPASPAFAKPTTTVSDVVIGKDGKPILGDKQSATKPIDKAILGSTIIKPVIDKATSVTTKVVTPKTTNLPEAKAKQANIKPETVTKPTVKTNQVAKPATKLDTKPSTKSGAKPEPKPVVKPTSKAVPTKTSPVVKPKPTNTKPDEGH